MESFFGIFVAFVCGILFNVFWGYLLGLGYGMLVFKRANIDCLFLLSKNIQSIYEIQQLKYMALEIMNKDKKFIDFQKHLDEREMQSIKNTVIRNYINAIPSRYNSLVEFRDWDSAIVYLNNEINGGKND